MVKTTSKKSAKESSELAKPDKVTGNLVNGKHSTDGVSIISSSSEPADEKVSNADAKGRVVLGVQYANKRFRVSEQPDGNLLLEPVVIVHEREAWFYRNPEAQAMVQEGIRQSRSGKGKYLGSFAGFADNEIDDED